MSSNIELATELTIAWLGNTHTRADAKDVPQFLESMMRAVDGLTSAPSEPEEVAPEYTPATTVRKSLASPDHILSMIDGKPYKTLRRHLSTNGLTPDEYRQRYGLKADYPMVAPSYSESRRTMAKTIGLGRKPGQTAAKAESEPKPAKATRKPRAAKTEAVEA